MPSPEMLRSALLPDARSPFPRTFWTKWLSPSDTSHPPSILAVVVFCKATGDHEPLRVILAACGLGVMTAEDRRFRDYGKADLEMKAARKRKKQLEEGL